VTQVFKPMLGANWIVGVVGQLQLEVLKSRMQQEYGLDVELDTSPYDTARWVSGDDANLERLVSTYRNQMATDRDGAPVFLAKSAWELGYVAEKFKALRFAKTRERHDVHAEG
jgi:peptide chain release factor 3